MDARLKLNFFYVTGTAPGKWMERFSERTDYRLDAHESADPLAVLLDPRDVVNDGAVTVGLVRLPDERITDDMHVVRLYEEAPGVAVPKDHELSLLSTITPEDLNELGDAAGVLFEGHGPVPVGEVKAQLDVVAANVGQVIAPRPLLRRLNVSGTVHADYAGSVATPVALVWFKDDDCDMVQDFVGIARGRKQSSSRMAKDAGNKGASRSAQGRGASGAKKRKAQGSKAKNRRKGKASLKGKGGARRRKNSPNQR